MNIAKRFRTPILKNICKRLLFKELAILKNTSGAAAFDSFIKGTVMQIEKLPIIDRLRV